MKLERWAHWAEIGASLAVVVSLVFLIQEVRYNTKILERQAVLDRTEAFNTPFFGNSDLPSILVRIKAVDGGDPVEQAFIDRYALTPEEAAQWVRHLALLWTVLEADYRVNGESGSLAAIARGLLESPDNQLFWELGAPQVSSIEFRDWVGLLRQP